MADKIQPSFSPGRRWKIGFDVLVRTGLVLAVVVMATYIGAKFYGRFYLSSQAQQLSTRTLSMLHSITNRVTVTVYYDKEDDWYPMIKALLDEYHSANQDIIINPVDYVRDAGEAEKIKDLYKFNSPTEKNLVIFDDNGRVKIVSGNELSQSVTEQVPSEHKGNWSLKNGRRRSWVRWCSPQAFLRWKTQSHSRRIFCKAMGSRRCLIRATKAI
jgi:hypothetical protein